MLYHTLRKRGHFDTDAQLRRRVAAWPLPLSSWAQHFLAYCPIDPWSTGPIFTEALDWLCSSVWAQASTLIALTGAFVLDDVKLRSAGGHEIHRQVIHYRVASEFSRLAGPFGQFAGAILLGQDGMRPNARSPPTFTRCPSIWSLPSGGRAYAKWQPRGSRAELILRDRSCSHRGRTGACRAVLDTQRHRPHGLA